MLRKVNRYLLFLFFLSNLIFAQKTDTLKLNLTYRSLPFNLSTQIPREFNNFAIVLSGGGARGFAEIGILKALEEAHIPITKIYGTSIGAIIGGMYSLGYSIDKISDILLNTDWYSFYSIEEKNRSQLFLEQKRILDNAFLTLRMDGLKPVVPKSINSGLLINEFFTKIKFSAPLNRNWNFDNLRYRFRAVATNLYTAKAVLIKKGDIAKAFRASSSVSFLMPPVKFDTLTLVDGGVVANIPVRSAKKDNSDFVIAVDVTSPLRKQNEIIYPWEIADQLVSLPMQEINNLNRKNADFIFRPTLNKKGDDFTNLPEVVKTGYKEKSNIPKLKNKIEKFLIHKNPKFGEIVKNCSFNFSDPIASEFAENFKNLKRITKARLYLELYILSKKYALKNVFLTIGKTEKNKNLISLHYSKYPLIKKIEINNSGLPEDIRNKIKAKFESKIQLSPENLLKIILFTLEKIRAEGNYSTEFSYYNFDKSTSSLNLYFVTPLLKKIKITGNEKSKDYVISRELEFKENQPVTKKDLDKSLDNLRLSDLFGSVQINLKNINPATDMLSVNVTEKPTRLVRFGMKMDNQYLARFFVDIRNENVKGTGNQLGFTFFGGLRTQEVTIEHIAPRIFSSYFTYKIQLKYKHILIPKFEHEQDNFLRTEEKFRYDQSEAGLILGIGRQITKLGNLLAVWKYSRAKIWNYPGYEENEIFNSLKLNFTIDSRSDVYFGNKGLFLNAFYELAFPLAGSKYNFNKTYFLFKKFIDISHNLILSPELKLGYADQQLPLSQQFSMGGQFDFFGTDIFQNRGGQVFKTSIGLRYKIPWEIIFPTFIEARYDLGRIWKKKESIKFNELVHGIGVSLSFKTPIGPAVFSVGRSFYFKNIIPNEIVIFGDYHFYFTLGYYFSFY